MSATVFRALSSGCFAWHSEEQEALRPGVWQPARATASSTVAHIANTVLAVFNLLPIPPLDGSHILESFLPYKALVKYRQIGRYAPLILIGVFLADRFLQTGIIFTVLHQPMRYLLWLFSGLWLG